MIYKGVVWFFKIFFNWLIPEVIKRGKLILFINFLIKIYQNIHIIYFSGVIKEIDKMKIQIILQKLNQKKIKNKNASPSTLSPRSLPRLPLSL